MNFLNEIRIDGTKLGFIENLGDSGAELRRIRV